MPGEFKTEIEILNNILCQRVWFTISKIKYFIQDDIRLSVDLTGELKLTWKSSITFFFVSCLKDTYVKEVRFTV